MYRKQPNGLETLKGIKATKGERIEQKIRRITVNKEPINDRAGGIFTERKDGVIPETDIRTDRMEFAAEAMDKLTMGKRATRNKASVTEKPNTTSNATQKQNDGGPEPIQTT